MGIQCASTIQQGSVDNVVRQGADDLERQFAGARPATIFVFASPVQPLGEVLGSLQRRFPNTLIVGASSSGEFAGASPSKDATALFAIAGDVVAQSGMGRGLEKSVTSACSQSVSGFSADVAQLPHQSAIVLLDPLAGASEEAVLTVADALGPHVLLAGGAAGDNLAMKRCVVGRGDAVANDAIVVVKLFTSAPLGVGVAHGHQPLSEPMRVSKADGGVVHEIDGRPAWHVWREQTRAAALAAGVDPMTMPNDARSAHLLRFEAGLATGESFKMRAPLSVNADGSIGFACGIPAGTTFRIMQGSESDQVDSARRAAVAARSKVQGPLAGALVFDCVCRDLILGERFSKALDLIDSELGRVPMAGFETYGEIALASGELSGFHNTTSVVVAFPGAGA